MLDSKFTSQDLTISVVCPTIKGREDHYDRCKQSYLKNTLHANIEWIPVHDRETCGIAWQDGASVATGDYLHLTADDLECHSGWDYAAMESADDGIIPMPTIYRPTGEIDPLGSETAGCTRIPFCTMSQWSFIGPMIPIHYYTDNYFSVRAKAGGLLLQEVPRYKFTHHWAQHGRGAGMPESDRMVWDRATYLGQLRMDGLDNLVGSL